MPIIIITSANPKKIQLITPKIPTNISITIRFDNPNIILTYIPINFAYNSIKNPIITLTNDSK